MDMDKPALAALANAIRSSRDTAGITQTELAERAGIRQDKVSRYERAVNEPGVAVLLAIDRACNQPPGTVLRLAGLLACPETAQQVIQADPGLDPETTRAFLTFYRLATGDRPLQDRPPVDDHGQRMQAVTQEINPNPRRRRQGRTGKAS